MRTGTMIAVAAALLCAAIATAGAQPPQPVAPRDPATPMPTWSLESLWQEIDCECECDCCDRIKQMIKQRLKDPRGRPMLAPESDNAKPRRQRDIERRDRRLRHPEGTESMWDHPWPRSGDRWLDAARAHKYRKARKAKRAQRTLDLNDEQRRTLDELRHHQQLQAIDLRAALQKEQLELKRLMKSNNVNDDQLRKRVDAMARIRADLEFNRLKARLEARRALTDEQLEKLKKRSQRAP